MNIWWGKVDIIYVFTGYCGYIALVLVFYSMLYLSICKDYKKISFFFIIGMTVTVLLSFWFVRILSWSITYGMLLALTIGFWLIACLEFSVVRSYFRENSGKYREVLKYFRDYWPLVATNFLYTLGLYVHNFVFWTTDLRKIVVESFVCVTTYDMATCLAMFTNISASVIFISRVEMNFHERYKAYSEAVIGGRGADIEITKKENVPNALRRTDESCQSAVYYYTCDFPAVHDFSSTAWIWRNDLKDLSVPFCRIFYFVFDVCGNYFSILF